ncbi:MAG: LamG-like jellyroll fold domain-containing protein [Candidatus Neomarinimicrobiota bacterium]
MSQNFTAPFKTTQNTVGGWFSNFKSNKYVSGSREFLSSNSLAAKVVFLILVVILFVYFLRLGILILGWIMSPTHNPKVVHGLKDAKKLKVVAQNPNISGSKPILRSRNQRGGIEFTWSVWLYIDDLQYKMGQKKHIFHKGSDTMKDGAAYPNNAPGLYLHPTRNTLIITMNTYTTMNEEVQINDIPLNKWINVAIRLQGQHLDVYINGQLALRHVFKSVPKQNYGKVYVNMNGGFSGSMSDLWYHDYALTGTQIMDIVRTGPDLVDRDAGDGLPVPPYLSLKWFFENDQAPMNGAAHWPTDSGQFDNSAW